MDKHTCAQDCFFFTHSETHGAFFLKISTFYLFLGKYRWQTDVHSEELFSFVIVLPHISKKQVDYKTELVLQSAISTSFMLLKIGQNWKQHQSDDVGKRHEIKGSG